MSSLTVEEDQKWLPTHVQVTVLRGRGLRGKGKHGTSDVYTIIQLGKEKYSTGVVEKTTEPEWREECCFELQPGVLESSCPAGSNELVLIVMHRALMGLDVFLGQAVIQLEKVFHETRCVKNEWYKLNSKTGKKEKERGDIQVTIQFTRNNLTASMYDLVMKDKGASTFGKLKERIRGKRRSTEEDSASAVLPSGYGSLYRMRQRLPSDGGGEEDYEDDEGGEARRSKMRTYFLRGKLRKSSDTRSSTSLGSESSESSSRGGSLSPTAGISVVVSDLSNSPSNSSNLTADNSPEHTANTSPKSSSLKCEFSDEAGEITIAVPQPSVCINGSHAYSVQPMDPGSGKPVDSLVLGPLQKSLPLSMSLQNLRPSTDAFKSPGAGDGRRWSFDKPGEMEKAAIAAALEQSGPMLGDDEEQMSQAALPIATSSSSSASIAVAESESQGKKQGRNLFSHGRSESAGKGHNQSKDESEQAPAATEEKHKGWFGSKDSHSKPSLVVSPRLEPSTDSHPPGPPVDVVSLPSPLHPTNPFCHPQTTSPPMSPCNPFFTFIQHNPVFDDPLTVQPLKPSLPPLPYLSSARPAIAQLFPHVSNPSPTLTHKDPTEDSIIGTGAVMPVKQPLTQVPTKEKKPLSMTFSNPFMHAGELDLDSEWDESFEAFATGRLHSPEDLTTDCKTQQITPSDHPLEHRNDNAALLPTADQNTNVDAALHHQPCTEFVFDVHKTISQEANINTCDLDPFAQLLETIPEHASFENDNITLNTNSPKLDACNETNQAGSATITGCLTSTNLHQAACHASSVKLNSISPDPTSSGLGSSTEEDFLSCLSCHSDKFSASSSEEAETQNFESKILGFEKSSDSPHVTNEKHSESEADITDRLTDLSLVDVAQHTVIQHSGGDEEADLIGFEQPLAPQSSVLSHQQPLIPARETGSQDTVSQSPNLSNIDLLLEQQPESNMSLQPDSEDGLKGKCGFNGYEEDFSSVSDSNTTDVMTPMTPDGKLLSTHPSLCVTTSSPEVRQSLIDSPIPFGLFGDFVNTSHIATSQPSQPFDDTLLHTRVTDQSGSSFFQSLNASIDSQDYQTCGSHSSSRLSSGSEPDETLHSANSTLCGDLSEIQVTADDAFGQDDSTDAHKHEESTQSEQYLCGAEGKTANPELSVMSGDNFDLLTESYLSCNPWKLTEGGVESLHGVLDDESLKCSEAQSAMLYRCQSESTLTHTFGKLHLASFGSDPGAIQESFSAWSDPDFPSLTSFAPSLTPLSSSTPVALLSLPPFANAAMRSPPSTPRAEVPKTMLQEMQQQQAANQQNSPHPVKPLTTATPAEERRTEGRSVLATGLEKLKSTIHPGRSSQLSEQDTERKKSATEGAGSYYHLNHSELVALLVQREAELARQKAEFERQKCLLAKRELELKKLKPQVKDLEDYIDTLLVRIMEQKPTLLQVRSKLK